MLDNVFIKQACIIFNEKGEILAMKRAENDDSRPGLRDIPGGSFEQKELAGLVGDPLMEKIRREVYEEAGFDVPNVSLLYQTSRKDEFEEGERLAMFMMYLAEYQGEKVLLSDEHTEFERVHPEEFLDRDSGRMAQQVQMALDIIANVEE